MAAAAARCVSVRHWPRRRTPTDQVFRRRSIPEIQELTDQEAASTTALSLQDLTEILREKSGADLVEIDQTGREPAFVFAWNNGCCYGGPPWAILAEPIGDRVLSADLPPNTRLATAKEQAVLDAMHQAARAATSLVWHQFMDRTFNCAVSIGAITLYARAQSLTADFAQIPADAWPVLEVADWETGVAVAPDNTAYWSIHAVASSDASELADRASGAEEAPPRDTAKKRVRSTYAEYQRAYKARTGEYATREGDEAWARADHYAERHVRDKLRPQFRDSLSLPEQTEFRQRRKKRNRRG